MARVEMKFGKFEDLPVSMKIEMTLGQWQEVVRVLRDQGTPYYAPLADLRIAAETCLEVFTRTYNAKVEDGNHV